MAVPALVLVGLLMVILGIFNGASLGFIGLGVVALIAAGVLETLGRRWR